MVTVALDERGAKLGGKTRCLAMAMAGISGLRSAVFKWLFCVASHDLEQDEMISQQKQIHYITLQPVWLRQMWKQLHK